MKRTRRQILRDAAVVGVAASFGGRIGTSGAAGAAAPPRKPNILLVLPDQHRHDAIGAAGDPVVATPTLDRLAREGTLFSRMWCQGPSCRPARASLITARYPYQHGIVGPDAPANDPAWPTVMKRLQSAGYATATFGKTDYGFKDNTGRSVPEGDRGREGGAESATGGDVRDMHPFIRSFGWDHASENPSQLDIAIPGYGSSYTDYLRAHGLYDAYCRQVRAHWRGSIEQYAGFVSGLEQEHDLVSFVAREVISWIEGRDAATAPGSKPFFITFAPNKPHHPYGADPKWAAYYAGKTMPRGPRDRVTPTNPLWAKVFAERYRRFPPESITDEFVDNSRRMYYAGISLVDQKVGEILDVLQMRGELDSTWVLYSSDHGELMGDHGLFDKTLFYHPSVGVPCIVRPPGGAAAREAAAPEAPSKKTITAPIEAIDLAATLLDIAGAESLDAPGRSLLPAMRGEETARYAFSEMARSKDTYFVAVTDGRYRYTVEQRSKTPCELFDLDSDPQEVVNLAEDRAHAKRITEMQGDLIEPHLAGRVL